MTALVRYVPDPQTLESGDNSIPFGQTMTRYLVRNNTLQPVYAAADAVATTDSPAVAAGARLLVDAPCNTLHLYVSEEVQVDDAETTGLEVVGWAPLLLPPAGNWHVLNDSALVGAVSELSGIPATWTTLLLVLSARADTDADHTALQLRFNGDATSAHYAWNVAGQTSEGSDDRAIVGLMSAAQSPEHALGTIEIWIQHYADTTWNKTAEATSSYIESDEVGVLIAHGAAYWRSTDAINSIQLALSPGNFVPGSRATLYGA